MCKGSNTTSTSTAPNPQAMAAYQDVLNRAQDVAQTPYQAYSGELVAPVNAQQTTGIGNINQNAGLAQPYIQQAGSLATQASQPLTQQQIQQYQSPYTQSVVDATSAWFNNQNQQQQQNVLGNAAAQGALGGDRVGVAQANLAAQQTASQAPVIAGLYNQGYQQAVGVAQQQQQNQANAAYSLGNLGVAGQNAALSGATAQVGAGSLQQGTQQAQDAALLQQYQIAQAFPYQQTQWLAGIDTGVGSNLGGTSTTTGPAPNPLAALLGAGVAGVGVAGNLGWKPFAARGGRIQGFAPGGTVASSDSPYVGVGWVPTRQITMGRGAPPPPGVAPPPNTGMDLAKTGLSFGRPAAGAATHANDGPSMPWDGFSPTRVGAYNDIGVSPAVAPLGPIYRAGGPVRGFAPGGAPMADDGAMTMADRWAPALEAIKSGEFDPQGSNYSYRYEEPFRTADAVPIPRPRPDSAPQRAATEEASPISGFAPQDGAPRPQQPLRDIIPGENAPVPDVLAYNDMAAPTAGFAPQDAGSPGAGVANYQSPTTSPWNGLIAAGLGMMASRSPFLANAVGEGGLAGLQTYSQQRAGEVAEAEKRQTLTQQNRRIDLDAKRLDQAADQARKHLELQERQLGETTRQHNIQERTKLIPPGYRQTDDGSLEIVPGGPQDPATIKAQTEAKRVGNALLDEDTITGMAKQYLAGDKSVMTNLGRGQQGAENIVKLRQAIAREARDAGMSPDQIATRMADYAGRTAAMRTLGTRGANVEYAANTANKAIDLAQEAYAKLPRGQFVPFNQLREMYDKKLSSPEQAAAYAATNTLVNEYARVASGGSNQATEGMRHHAREMLNTAMSQEAFNAVLGMMRREIQTAKSAYNETRQEFLADHGTAPKPGATPAGPAGAPTLSAQDKQALDWAKSNPNDPRASDIKKRLGVP